MRILHLSWEYPPVVYGGLGRHVHALAEAQAALGHDVVVVTQADGPANLDEIVNDVRVIRVPQDPPRVPRTELIAWVMGFDHSVTRAGVRLAREWTPDVVHGHDWLVTQAAATMRTLFEVPLVATIHATEAGRHQGWLPGEMNRSIHTMEWWLTYEARRVITCSSHMSWEVTRLFELPAEKVDVIPNGIDVTRWSGASVDAERTRGELAPDGPLVVYSGRLEWEKGVHDLLEALPAMRARHPGLRLAVVGEGSQASELARQAAELGVTADVTFVGWVEDDALVALAAAADVAVVPSIYEPFGLVALEAAAVGTPLVVADTGGLREVVEHGVTGLRFAARDVEALTHAVSALLDDEVLARRLVRDARDVVERDYSWHHIAARTVEVYQRAAREEAALLMEQTGRGQRPVLVVRDGNLLEPRPATPSSG
jgi:glycogen(starch) synthase